MKTFKDFMSESTQGLEESRYKLVDGKAEITRANYKKVHRDYKSGKKGSEMMMVNGGAKGAILVNVKFIEEGVLDESFKQYLPKVPKDLHSLVRDISELTQDNDHGNARWLLASYLKDKKLVQSYEAILILQDYFHSIDEVYSARQRLDKALFYQAKQKFSKEEYQQVYGAF